MLFCRRRRRLPSPMHPTFARLKGGVAPLASRAPASLEPLEARRLMHADHEHLGSGAAGAGVAANSAPLNPAGSVFVDAGNVKLPFTDAAGQITWGVDAGAALGGKPVRGKFAVAGTEDDALFASRRQGKLFAFSVPVAADGLYTLSLLFVDTVKKPGKRLFNVDAEGQRLETSLDIVARAGGPRTALVLSHDLTATGGTFDLALSRVKGAAVLSGFSLAPAVGAEPEPPVGQPRPPAAPTNVTAAAQSSSAVALAWSDNSGDETGFEIARAAGASSSFVPLRTLPAGATAHVDGQGLEPGRTYLYRVRAVSPAGASAWSEVATVATPAVTPTLPAAPTNLAAQALAPTAVSLSWTHTGGGDNNTSLEIERSADGGATFTPLATLPPGSANSHLDTGGSLAPASAYAYRVRAVNGAGASAWSNLATVTTPAAGTPVAPAAPTNLAAQALGPTSVALTWTDNSPNETGFVVERSTDGGAFAPIATTPADAEQHADTTVSPGATYAYRVRATNGAGASVASNEQSVTTPTTPGPTDAFTQINWSARAAGPIGRAEALRAAIGGKLYVFGGFSGDDGPVARSDVYDPATDTWTRIADMPTRLTHAGAAADGRDVYFVGGYIGTGPGYKQQFGTLEVWRYNVDADAYSRLPDLPAARAGGGAAVIGRTLHYFGGNDAARQDVGDHFALNLDNPDAGWSSRAALPDARSHMGYAALGGLIYAIGGQTGNDEGLTTTAAVHAYDPAADAWSPRASMPKAVSHVSSSTVVIGGRILVFGGETGHNQPIADAYAFDPAANAWATLTPLPAPRFSGVAAAIGDLLYFTSGSSKQDTFLGTPVR